MLWGSTGGEGPPPVRICVLYDGVVLFGGVAGEELDDGWIKDDGGSWGIDDELNEGIDVIFAIIC